MRDECAPFRERQSVDDELGPFEWWSSIDDELGPFEWWSSADNECESSREWWSVDSVDDDTGLSIDDDAGFSAGDDAGSSGDDDMGRTGGEISSAGERVTRVEELALSEETPFFVSESEGLGQAPSFLLLSRNTSITTSSSSLRTLSKPKLF